MREERSTDIRRCKSPIRNWGCAQAGVLRARGGLGKTAVPCPLGVAPEARRHSHIYRVLRGTIARCRNKDLLRQAKLGEGESHVDG